MNFVTRAPLSSMKFTSSGVSKTKHIQSKFGRNSHPDICMHKNMSPTYDLLGLLKHTKCALKQQLGGPRNALLCIFEAMFNFLLVKVLTTIAAPRQ